MGLFRQKPPIEAEWEKLQKQERRFLEKRKGEKESRIKGALEDKVPEKLQKALDEGFIKAFALVFQKGTGAIEKTYNREKLEQAYRVDEYAARLKGDRRSLKTFSQKARGAGTAGALLSGASGAGLGILGVGLPDIALFTAMLIRSLYRIALGYGFSYEEDREKQLILRIILGAVSDGEKLEEIDREINFFCKTGCWPQAVPTQELIRQAAGGLSGELLYLKFLQGIPLVGAVGGICDGVYLKRIAAYGELKYRRRFYEAQRGEKR